MNMKSYDYHRRYQRWKANENITVLETLKEFWDHRTSEGFFVGLSIRLDRSPLAIKNRVYLLMQRNHTELT